MKGLKPITEEKVKLLDELAPYVTVVVILSIQPLALNVAVEFDNVVPR